MKRTTQAALTALGLVLLGACSSTTAAPAAAPAASQGRQAVSPSAEVIAQGMGLAKAPGYVAYTASTDPNHLLGRQNGYTSKINWGPDGNTGTIEVFPDQADAIARQDYIKGFTCPFGFGYLTMQGTADLRLGCDLTPAQAAPIEARFREAASP